MEHVQSEPNTPILSYERQLINDHIVQSNSGFEPPKLLVMNSVTESKKLHSFTNAPLGDKSVREVAGIGEALERKLNSGGVTKAYQLVGLYLMNMKDDAFFINWLKENGIPNNFAIAAKNCISDWVDTFC